MDDGESVYAGPWQKIPRGLSLCGNATEPMTPALKKNLPLLRAEATSFAGGYIERLNKGIDPGQLITGEEVESFLAMSALSGDMWETVSRGGGATVTRHRSRGLFGGCMFTQLHGTLLDTTPAHVAHSCLRFAERTAWDKAVVRMKLVHSMETNDVVHYEVRAPPLGPRDFVVYHTIWRHESGSRLLIYSRSGADELLPPNRSVRAKQFVQAVEISEAPNGVSFQVTTAVDPRMPLMPKWIMTVMVPREFRKWLVTMQRQCLELKRAGLDSPCARFFEPAFDIDTPISWTLDDASSEQFITQVTSISQTRSPDSSHSVHSHILPPAYCAVAVQPVKLAGDGKEQLPYRPRPVRPPPIDTQEAYAVLATAPVDGAPVIAFPQPADEAPAPPAFGNTSRWLSYLGSLATKDSSKTIADHWYCCTNPNRTGEITMVVM